AVTELTRLVVSPAREPVVRIDGARGVHARGHLPHGRARDWLRRRALRDSRAAELRVVVYTPTEEHAVRARKTRGVEPQPELGPRGRVAIGQIGPSVRATSCGGGQDVRRALAPGSHPTPQRISIRRRLHFVDHGGDGREDDGADGLAAQGSNINAVMAALDG